MNFLVICGSRENVISYGLYRFVYGKEVNI